MSINVGPIDGMTTHLATTPAPAPRALCLEGGGKLTPRRLHLFADDPAKVDCTDCIEWMHA